MDAHPFDATLTAGETVIAVGEEANLQALERILNPPAGDPAFVSAPGKSGDCESFNFRTPAMPDNPSDGGGQNRCESFNFRTPAFPWQ